MDTFLKQSSINNDKNCYCIAPFNFNELNDKINSVTGRLFTDEDKKQLQARFNRYSNQKNCQIIECCNPTDSYNYVDKSFLENFKKLYPSVALIKNKNVITKIILSKIKKNESGWIEPTPYIVCKVSKSKISDTNDPNIKEAVNVVQDCFLDSCDNLETNTIMSLNDNNQRLKVDYSHTAFDDARVEQAILEGNITYVKKYIRQYKSIDNKLINNDYRNRMLHIAAKSSNEKILKMLLALRANVDLQNKELDTPLHLAVRNNRYNNSEELLKIGANKNIANDKGETPIFDAAKIGSLELLRLLFNSGSNHLDVNKNGDSVLNVCILQCPASNKKVEIVRFLIDKGINCEVKNNSNKTTLELISELLNEENKEKRYEIAANYITNTENFTVNEVDIESLSIKKRTLLEIQTLVFNAIIRSNKDKYKDYINVSEIPKGAPIEILNHLCVGEGNITGNEDSYECNQKGGKIIKIDEPTTKIKLELIPELQSEINNIEQSDLYYQKIQDKIDINKTSRNVEKYNEMIEKTNLVPTTIPNLGSQVISRKDYAKEVEMNKRKKLEEELTKIKKMEDQKNKSIPKDGKDLKKENNINDNEINNNENILDDSNNLGHPEFEIEDKILNEIPKEEIEKQSKITKALINQEKEQVQVLNDDILNKVLKILMKYKLTLISILIVIILIILIIIYRKNILKFKHNKFLKIKIKNLI